MEYSIVCNKENRLNNSANEFIINITKYKSLENPFKQEYYFQDVSKSGKLSANIMQKQRLREQWSMKKFIQNTHR